MKETTSKKIAQVIDAVSFILYAPFYYLGWLLLKIFNILWRVILALLRVAEIINQFLIAMALALMLDLPAAWNIIKTIFKHHGRLN